MLNVGNDECNCNKTPAVTVLIPKAISIQFLSSWALVSVRACNAKVTDTSHVSGLVSGDSCALVNGRRLLASLGPLCGPEFAVSGQDAWKREEEGALWRPMMAHHCTLTTGTSCTYAVSFAAFPPEFASCRCLCTGGLLAHCAPGYQLVELSISTYSW